MKVDTLEISRFADRQLGRNVPCAIIGGIRNPFKPTKTVGSTSRLGQTERPPVETGVWYEKLAEARLPNGAIFGFPVRFNALCVSDVGFNVLRRCYAPNLNYTQNGPPMPSRQAFGNSSYTIWLAVVRFFAGPVPCRREALPAADGGNSNICCIASAAPICYPVSQ